jgi:hypothetical protein
VLLGRSVFSEVLQRDAQPRRFAQEIARALDGRRRLLEACAEVEGILGPNKTPSRQVVQMLSPWLGARTARDDGRPVAGAVPFG